MELLIYVFIKIIRIKESEFPIIIPPPNPLINKSAITDSRLNEKFHMDSIPYEFDSY